MTSSTYEALSFLEVTKQQKVIFFPRRTVHTVDAVAAGVAEFIFLLPYTTYARLPRNALMGQMFASASRKSSS